MEKKKKVKSKNGVQHFLCTSHRRGGVHPEEQAPSVGVKLRISASSRPSSEPRL